MAEVQLIYLPPGEDGNKQGVDDYLAAGNSVDDLLALAKPELRELPRGEDETPYVPYRETPHGLVWEKPTREGPIDTPLTNFNARIVADTVEDDGAEQRRSFEIEAELRGRRSSFSVPAERFFGMGWPSERLGAAAILHPGFGTKDHARAGIQLLSGDVPLLYRHAHTGWSKVGDVWAYLHAGGAIGSLGSLEDVNVALSDGRLGDYALPNPPKGRDLVRAIEASLRLWELAPSQITVPLLAAVYRAALGEAAPVDLSIFVSGPTGAYKTELTALAQAHYGDAFNGRNLPGNWISTENTLEKEAFALKDAIFTVDDFAPTGTIHDAARLHSKADRLLRGQGNRSGRGRMRPYGSLRPTFYPRGLIVSSGEDVPRGQSLRSRMLVLELSRDDVDLDVLTEVQDAAARGLLASAMSGYLRCIAPQMDDLKADLPIRLRGLRAEAAGAGTHARTPDAVASLTLGLESFLEFAAESGAITDARAGELRASGREALLEAAEAQAEQQSGEEPTQRFLELLGACIVAGDAHVAAKTGEKPEGPGRWGWRKSVTETDEYERSEWRPQGKCVGWLEKDGSLMLEPEASFAAVQRMAREQGSGLPITQRTLWKRMAQKDLLASRDAARGRNTIRANIAGERKTVVHLVPGALSPGNGPNDPSDPTSSEDGPSGPKRRAVSVEGGEETAREDGPKPAQTAHSGPVGPVGPFTGGGQAEREDPTRDSARREEASVRPGGGDEFLFDDGPEDDHDDGPEEEEVDHLAELAALGLRRAETSFTAAADTPDGRVEDPVARKLRHEVGFYMGRRWWSDDIGYPTPLALTAEDLCEAGPPIGDDGKRSDVPWPAAAEEMSPRLRRAVSSLQAGKQRFWDLGLSAWYAGMRINHPRDTEKVCRPARLHAELWTNEESGEEIWVLVALKEGWRVPDEAVEEAAWLRVTSGRSPWAEPELLPEP